MNLWKCDDGTFDIIDDEGEVVYYNIPQNVLADTYDAAQRIIREFDLGRTPLASDISKLRAS